MIFTELYIAEQVSGAKSRFDITNSNGEHPFIESLCVNKRKFNVGGLSINFGDRPERYRGKGTDKVLTKNSSNITTLQRPEPNSHISYGDINTTNDACIMLYNEDFKEVGITKIVILIARGLKHDKRNLWELFSVGEYDHELALLMKNKVDRFKEKKGA